MERTDHVQAILQSLFVLFCFVFFFYLAVSWMYLHHTALLVVSSQGRFKNYNLAILDILILIIIIIFFLDRLKLLS